MGDNDISLEGARLGSLCSTRKRRAKQACFIAGMLVHLAIATLSAMSAGKKDRC